MEVAEGEELPIIEFNFKIPLLYFRFPSGFGRVKVTVIVPPSEENEAGRINICWEKVNEYSTPGSTAPPSTPHSPASVAAAATTTAVLPLLLLLLIRNLLDKPQDTLRF